MFSHYQWLINLCKLALSMASKNFEEPMKKKSNSLKYLPLIAAIFRTLFFRSTRHGLMHCCSPSIISSHWRRTWIVSEVRWKHTLRALHLWLDHSGQILKPGWNKAFARKMRVTRPSNIYELKVAIKATSAGVPSHLIKPQSLPPCHSTLMEWFVHKGLLPGIEHKNKHTLENIGKVF